jgi:hypothetical protein
MLDSGSTDKKIMLTLILLLISVLAISLVNPAISKKSDNNGKKFSSNGSIKELTGIEIYWDSKGTNRVTSIAWGSLEPGTEKTATMFIRNLEKNQITLNYYTSNWMPSEITDYLTLKWDYNEQAIKFREMVQVIFTLVVSENIESSGAFDFDITIGGSQ